MLHVPHEQHPLRLLVAADLIQKACWGSSLRDMQEALAKAMLLKRRGQQPEGVYSEGGCLQLWGTDTKAKLSDIAAAVAAATAPAVTAAAAAIATEVAAGPSSECPGLEEGNFGQDLNDCVTSTLAEALRLADDICTKACIGRGLEFISGRLCETPHILDLVFKQQISCDCEMSRMVHFMLT